MSTSKHLAIDLGAESGRLIVGVLENGKISLTEVHRFPNKQIKILGHLHWNVPALFEEIKKGLSFAVQNGHMDIESIGVDTWGVDFALVGFDNNLIAPPYCYRDFRTDGMMEKVFEIIPSKTLYSKTGIQFMQINSLYQLYSECLSKTSPLNSCDKILFMPDLFNFLLTGQKKNEYTIASTSQLLNAQAKEYDREIFSALGLPIEKMAPVIMPGTIIGKLTPEIVKNFGLENVDVVAVGGHDTANAIAAVPSQNNNWAYLSSGTWSLIGVEVARPIINEHSLKNNFTNEGGIDNTITFLKNVTGLWLLQQTRKSFQELGENFSYEEYSKLAMGSEPFKFVLDPDDECFLNPPEMIDAIKYFCKKTGQFSPQTKGEFARAILESLAFKYRETIDKINSMTGQKIEKLHIVGGGSQNELLNQFTADACGIDVIAGPIEATALGNIMVQAMAKGKISSIQEGRKIISNSFSLKTFNPANSDKWNEVYQNLKIKNH